MVASAQAQPCDITLQTTVARLLEQHPQLEELLMALAPAFKRLRHPILRRTVARVTTIKQAAEVGGLDAEALLATLRRAAGQSSESPAADEAGESVEVLTEEPAWARERGVRRRVDADALLDAGETPFNTVLERARELRSTEVLEVIVSFKPAPMLTMLGKAGHRTALIANGEDRYRLLVGPTDH